MICSMYIWYIELHLGHIWNDGEYFMHGASGCVCVCVISRKYSTVVRGTGYVPVPDPASLTIQWLKSLLKHIQNLEVETLP